MKQSSRKKASAAGGGGATCPPGSINRRISPSASVICNPLLHYLVIICLGLIAYANTFHVPFIFDDHTSIVENPLIRRLDSFVGSWEGYRYNPRRFIGYLTFALNYRFGGLAVTGYHAVNTAIHLGTALLVYKFARLTLRTPRLDGSSLEPVASLVAWGAALVFVTHPVQTQAVTYIVQRFASLTAFFYLLTLVLYAAARLRQERLGILGEAHAIVLLAGAGLSAVLALRTKEIAFTLPFAMILWEFVFFRLTGRKRKILWGALVLALMALVAVIVHAVRSPGFLADVGESLTEARTISRSEYFLTQLRVLITYIRLLIVPVGQNFDYDFPVYGSLFSAPVLLSLLFLCAVAAGIAMLFRKARNADPALVVPAFGACWFFLTLAVESSIIPISDVIFEHRLYLPLAGVSIGLSAALFMAGRRLSPSAPIVVVVVLGMLLCVLTRHRNEVWRSGETLWRDVVAKSPKKGRAHSELGKVLFDAKRYEEAIEENLIAIRLAPGFLPPYTNLGAAYNKVGATDKAVETLRQALKLKPDQPETLNNLGTAYERLGLLDEAAASLEAALKLNPEYAVAHNNLGAVYRKQGRMDAAIRSYLTAQTLRPDYASPFNNLGVVYAISGRLDEAAVQMEKAVALDPGNPEFRTNLVKLQALREKK